MTESKEKQQRNNAAMKRLTNRQLNELEESWVVKKFVEHLNLEQKSSDWQVEECPIISVPQNKLTSGDSIPDAIIGKKNRREWLEVTIVSRSPEDRAVLSKKRRGLLSSDNEMRRANLSILQQDTIVQISDAIIKKSKKNYGKFASYASASAAASSKGILIVGLDVPDHFHDEYELAKIVENFDEHVLFSLGCGGGFFAEILLYSYFPSDGVWSWRFTQVMSCDVMKRLQIHQNIKNRLLENMR